MGTMNSDKRRAGQSALLVTTTACQEENSWLAGEVAKSLTLTSIPLIKVSEMLGYDENTRPGAGARIEQSLYLKLELNRFDAESS